MSDIDYVAHLNTLKLKLNLNGMIGSKVDLADKIFSGLAGCVSIILYEKTNDLLQDLNKGLHF